MHDFCVGLDLEGTTINVEHVHKESWRKEIMNRHVPISSFTKKWQEWTGAGDQAIARDIVGILETQLDTESLIQEKRRRYNNLLKEAEIQLRPGFQKIFDTLTRAGVPICIGSITPRIQADHLLIASGLSEVIPSDRIILAEDVPPDEHKPHPRVYLLTAERCGCSPSKQLVFEDSVPGVKAAVAAGSTVIAVPTLDSADYDQQLRRAGAYHVIHSWEELTPVEVFRALEG